MKIKYLCSIGSVKYIHTEISWLSCTKLGQNNAAIHKIDTGDAEPVKERHHSPYILEYFHKELDNM